MFVDHIRIFAKAGDGGNGAVSFRREKFVPRGGPDGGDGGRGGSIILKASQQVGNLVNFFYDPNIKVKAGNAGGGRQKSGKSSADKIVPVPMGTVIYRVPSELAPKPPMTFLEEEAAYADGAGDEAESAPQVAPAKPSLQVEDLEWMADLNEEGAEFILCQGGKGGKGNIHFKSSRNQVPTQFTEGIPGEEGYFYLELRTIADAGLVGYPNAGKSTLLSQVSAAHPKIAAYPFTTLTPMIGVVETGQYERFTIADIPGLIEGAHRNVGLGHDFLRHIVRCKLLLFVIDMAGSEGRNPCEDLARLREELSLYDASLVQRDWLVVANKMDLPESAENLLHFRQRFPKPEIIEISAGENRGLGALKARLAARIAS